MPKLNQDRTLIKVSRSAKNEIKRLASIKHMSIIKYVDMVMCDAKKDN